MKSIFYCKYSLQYITEWYNSPELKQAELISKENSNSISTERISRLKKEIEEFIEIYDEAEHYQKQIKKRQNQNKSISR